MKSESEVQQECVILARTYGCHLMRNNSGAGTFVDEETGNRSHVRFGLDNTSKERHKKIKSSDYIGIWLREPHVTGMGFVKLGVFVAVEFKKEGWKFNPKDQREVAQLAYIDFIKANGGIAGFVASTDDLRKLLGVS